RGDDPRDDDRVPKLHFQPVEDRFGDTDRIVALVDRTAEGKQPTASLILSVRIPGNETAFDERLQVPENPALRRADLASKIADADRPLAGCKLLKNFNRKEDGLSSLAEGLGD